MVVLFDTQFIENEQYCVQLSKMGKNDTAPCHTDYKDIDYQVMICCGDYKGGELRGYNEDRSKYVDFNLDRNLVRFDARLPHEVLPVINGIRYSVIVYRHYDEELNSPKPIIDFVENHPDAITINFKPLKKCIENIALAWIQPGLTTVESKSSSQILKVLRCSHFEPEQKNRTQLKKFISYVKEQFDIDAIKKHCQQCKFFYFPM